MIDEDQLFPTSQANEPSEAQEAAREKLNQLYDVLDEIEEVDEWAEGFISNNYENMELSRFHKLSPAQLEKVDELWEQYRHLAEE